MHEQIFVVRLHTPLGHWELLVQGRPIRPAVQMFGAAPHTPPGGQVPPFARQGVSVVQVMKLQV